MDVAGSRPVAAPAEHARPAVSLVVSTRDRGRFLAPFLESLEAIRTHHALEVVIVDNGSVDETWAILSRFAQHSRLDVRLVREPRPGLSHARNAGVRAARGAIIGFTDDDCYPRPDFIDAVVGVFGDPALGFMGGRILLHDPQDDPVCITTREDGASFPAGTFITTGEIQGACMAFRRTVFEDVGLFDTAFGAGAPLMGAEDCEMAARAAFAGWNGGFFVEPTIRHHHRRRGAGSARITWSYDYSRGAFFAKMLLQHPQRRRAVVRNWYWVTPVFWRLSPRAARKFWREARGALHYALRYAWTSRRRAVALPALA